MVSEERQARILERIGVRGSVRVSELVELFDVASETARRDLDHLAERGLVRRSHGGASALAMRSESGYTLRLAQHLPEKEAIAAVALQYVEDGSSILLDSGTTVVQLAKRLGSKRELLVVTNAVPNLVALQDAPGVDVVVTGGLIRHDTYDAVGDLAVATLQHLRVDQAFISIHAASVASGLMYPKLEEVGVKRAMIESASEVTLLAHSSKLGHESLVRVASLDVLTRIITSTGVDADFVRGAEELGIEVIVAAPLR